MRLNGLNLISQTYFFLLRLGAVIIQDYIFLGESHKDQFLLQLFSPFICYRWEPFFGNIKYHSYHYADDTQIYLLLLRTTRCRSIVAKRSIPALWIFRLNSLTWVQTSEIWFSNTWWKQKDHADWHLQWACYFYVFFQERVISLHIIVNMSMRDSHKHNLLCLTWTFSEWLEKNLMCEIILGLCITVGLNI